MAARVQVRNGRMHECTNAKECTNAPMHECKTRNAMNGPTANQYCLGAFLHWCILAFLLSSSLKAQPPDVDAMLEKAADYVDVYKRDFVGVVADESYRQEVIGR